MIKCLVDFVRFAYNLMSIAVSFIKNLLYFVGNFVKMIE